jgi:hypothetical protein
MQSPAVTLAPLAALQVQVLYNRGQEVQYVKASTNSASAS